MIHKNMTVGYLLNFIKENNISDDAIILTERVKDVYYDKYGWDKQVVRKEGYNYWQNKKLIDKAKSGEFNDKEQYPKITQKEIDSILSMEGRLENDKTQYTAIWCPVKYKDDDNLYLDLHY